MTRALRLDFANECAKILYRLSDERVFLVGATTRYHQDAMAERGHKRRIVEQVGDVLTLPESSTLSITNADVAPALDRETAGRFLGRRTGSAMGDSCRRSAV